MQTFEVPAKPFEFSLVGGGPVDRLFRLLKLSDANLGLAARRIAVICTFTWLPLLLLSLFEGHATAGLTQKPFLTDITTHVRFLVALPLLLAGDLLVRRALDPRIKPFLRRKIVRDAEVPNFQAALESSGRFRDSSLVELIILVLVCAFALFIYSRGMATAPSWNVTSDGTGGYLTLAGYWMLFVSLPIFQFFLIRWYARMLNWFLLLWRISKLNLNLVATHADLTGGMGFLAKTTFGFAAVLLAHGALLSAYIANQVVNNRENLLDFKLESVAFVALLVLMVFGPLFVFTPNLIAAKKKGAGIYGDLMGRYTQDFEKKWIDGEKENRTQLLGASDIQSLADMGNSYAVVGKMRTVPFTAREVIISVACAGAPLVPLLLFAFSVEELVEKLVSILF